MIFHNFDLLHKEVDPQEEKDQINVSVMTIGNGYFITNREFFLSGGLFEK